MSAFPKIFVAGATGLLGGQIVKALLDRGAPVRALVRPGADEEKKRSLTALGSDRLELVEGDITDPAERLAEAVGDATTVISAVQGGPDVIVDGQANLLRAAEKAGARRFIPSDFAFDLTKLDDGDNFMIDWRRQAAAARAGSPLDVISVLNGAFYEVMTGFMGLIDWEQGTLSHWGDPDQPLDLTSVADTAAYTAAVALDPAATGTLRFAGEVMSMRQFHDAVQRGSGRTLELRHLGTSDDLRAEIARQAAVAQNPFDYVALQYQWCMVSGKAKFDRLDNERYPDVTPVSMTDFVRATSPAH
ncbi:Isoflavone reductase homolog P3 [[Actinomadura] parvosata subsp. kistnae]|uniref:NmrA family protein n=1 Tax=[Actinomadura] parvosata subsp. kistnae TaxID=1909395 RepID=A0A1V0AEA5_9ACTN|nr:NmrA family NAD(P)-binding protein [Nonomuraea sp. ATCC 55076]AQZ68560.1 NmrA family protein [Nonomuraea sp. ATCC 55076]SPL92973.1 Isoflavone reductase homolog P3 [Actinomadura parvosata subsp. kistnae]